MLQNVPSILFHIIMGGLLTLLRSIQKRASRRVTGCNGREFFALRHSSKVLFHPLV